MRESRIGEFSETLKTTASLDRPWQQWNDPRPGGGGTSDLVLLKQRDR